MAKKTIMKKFESERYSVLIHISLDSDRTLNSPGIPKPFTSFFLCNSRAISSQMPNSVLGQKDIDKLDGIQTIAAKTIKVLTWWETINKSLHSNFKQ